MSFSIDYNQMLDDVVTLLQDGAIGFVLVEKLMDPIKVNSADMPLCDVRPFHVEPEITAGNHYYITFTIELEIVAQDLSSPKQALKIVLEKLGLAQTKLTTRPFTIASWDTVVLGPVDFLTSQDEKSGAGVAAAIAQIKISMYSD